VQPATLGVLLGQFVVNEVDDGVVALVVIIVPGRAMHSR